MKLSIITCTFLLLIANLATAQTMQDVIDNLVKSQLISDEYKTDMELILTRRDDTSNSAILSGLMYVEMIKKVGREHIGDDFASVAPYLKMSLNHSRQQQDSVNQHIAEYLTKIRSAGLINDSLYAEIKLNIQSDTYEDTMTLIYDLFQKTAYLEYFDTAVLSQQKKDYLTSKQIEDAVLGWHKAGILNHLTKTQISSAKKKALAADNESLNDVLLNFPKVVHWFDTELVNLEDPYAELLIEFSNISRGAFKPTNISDNFSKPENNTVLLKFSLNSKEYSKVLRIHDDWIDSDFLEVVDQAVSENKLTGQFYQLYEGGQGAIFIFLTPDQHRYLKTNNLLTFAEE
jgi:hypothetical protein